MHWKPTWILAGLAAALFAFIILFERRAPEGSLPPPRLVSFRAAEVTNIQVRLTNQLLLTVGRTREDAPWNLRDPIQYPAQPFIIEGLLQALETALPQTEITPQDLRASKRTIAEFGLDVPHATLTLQHNGQRTEVMFGSRTPVGDGVYVQVLNRSDIYILRSDVAVRLPHTINDWRSTELLSTTVPIGYSGVEVRASGRGFAFDFTNRPCLLTKPTRARADPAKVLALLRKLHETQVRSFVTDNPRADLDVYGLEPPELELVLLLGTNEQFVVQFGKSPTNDPTSVYARRMLNTNIVTVPRSTLDALEISHGDLRDLHLVNWGTNLIDVIEVIGPERFSVRRQTNGTWIVGDATTMLADTNAVLEVLDAFSRMEGTVERDVVTDFAEPYGLSPPFREYVLKTTVTNNAGGMSNQVVAELQLGNKQGEKCFARRPDEATVYSLAGKDVVRLPRAAWQMRDRRVWNFTTNQVQTVSVRHEGRSATILRNSSGAWSTKNSAPLEELLSHLGELRADVWFDRGDEHLAQFGFNDENDQIKIELKNGDKPQSLVLAFGTNSPNGFRYSMTVVDGQTWVFQCPVITQIEIINVLFSTLFRQAQEIPP